MKVLFDLYPVLHGLAGIPLETRLIFRGLAAREGIAAGGLLTPPAAGIHGPLQAPRRDRDRRAAIVAHAAFLARLAGRPRDVGPLAWPAHRLARLRASASRGTGMLRAAALAATGAAIAPFPLRPEAHEDFAGPLLAEGTMATANGASIDGAPLYGLGVGYGLLESLFLGRRPAIRVDTRPWDVVVAHKYFPARLSPGTRLVIRHHDAVPLSHPHLTDLPDRSLRLHAAGLAHAVAAGATFVCNSAVSRDRLVALFPEAESAATVIPCAVSAGFRPVDDPRLVDEIVLARQSDPDGEAWRRNRPPGRFNGDYMLVVSTLEPRKNHAMIVDAWRRYRARSGHDLKLVMVANRGWAYDRLLRRMAPHVAAGDLFHLERVPGEELRALYSHARLFVTASHFEGFNIGGIEAMLCDCPVLASDIPTHREVYGDAALYFDRLDPESLAELLATLLAEGAQPRLDDIRRRGRGIAARYRDGEVVGQWADLLQSLAATPEPRRKKE